MKTLSISAVFISSEGSQSKQTRYVPASKKTTHTEKSFRSLIILIRNQIVLTIFRLIWIQTDIRLDPKSI